MWYITHVQLHLHVHCNIGELLVANCSLLSDVNYWGRGCAPYLRDIYVPRIEMKCALFRDIYVSVNSRRF